ncbi:triacylglycerol lipase OBL1-like [Bidens hawaiensis]|uniref:triacylglycerol lipase OBL1-like n=1 Tax=Bidens hawaiensis TaxID=980011 RepID=UPI004048FDA0
MGDEYMRLDLNEVGVWELCLLLLDEKIGARKFINSHDDEGLRGTFTHRFLIFISIVFIRGLKLISRPLECLGRFIESFLNLWTHYASFCMLVMNTIQGKNELSRESPKFSSAVGLTDTREELDDEIHRDDPRYISALAIMAAKTAYDNEARIKKIVKDWKMEFVGFYNCSDGSSQPTQAFIFIDKTGDHDLICVSFRGTSPFSSDDWCTDLDFSWFLHHGIGFMKALGLQKKFSWPKELEEHEEYDDKIFAYYKIRQVLRKKLDENENTRFIVTGHSLGGALAVLFPAILQFHHESELLDRLAGVYTFGQPRVGDGEFCKSMEALLGAERYFRFVYSNDIVPRIPFDNSAFKFKHFGDCYYFSSFYKRQKVMREVPNKNYFWPVYWPVSIGLMYLNALFEMVRSGALTYAFGRKYKEGDFFWGFDSLD